VAKPGVMRSNEADLLIGDASRAREKLGWKPKVRFGELVEMMVDVSVELERTKLAAIRRIAKG
jgi:GDPmannose 4,6-dehydratase